VNNTGTQKGSIMK